MKKTLKSHLMNRHFDVRLYPGCSVSEEDRTVTVFLRDFSGAITGYLTYRPDSDKRKRNDEKGRYYVYATKGKAAIFGMETTDFGSPFIVLTEGIFDACRFHNYGVTAYALLSNNPKPLRNQLSLLTRPKFAVCDGGSAGRSLGKYGTPVYLDGERDPGDLSENEIREMIDGFYQTCG